MASVLVVDDAAFMRLTIRQILEPEGYSIAGEAGNGIEAWQMYAQLKPDVVILDITMPDMNGLEALRRIKIMDENARIIICSALGQHEMVAKAIEYGAQEFIVKPFQPNRLLAAVRKVLSR